MCKIGGKTQISSLKLSMTFCNPKIRDGGQILGKKRTTAMCVFIQKVFWVVKSSNEVHITYYLLGSRVSSYPQNCWTYKVYWTCCVMSSIDTCVFVVVQGDKHSGYTLTEPPLMWNTTLCQFIAGTSFRASSIGTMYVFK